MGEAKNSYICLFKLFKKLRDTLRDLDIIFIPTRSPFSFCQDVQGSPSRTEKVHGQEAVASDQWRAFVVGDFARLRSLYESRHRRGHREEEDRRAAADRNGCDPRQLYHHAGSFGSDLTKTLLHHFSPCFHSISRVSFSFNCHLRANRWALTVPIKRISRLFFVFFAFLYF